MDKSELSIWPNVGQIAYWTYALQVSLIGRERNAREVSKKYAGTRSWEPSVVITYNHIRAFSTFVILVLFNCSIVLWKSSISKSEFCWSWPSYPSRIANSNATTNGISERSIPWRISKNRRTTLSFGCYNDFYNGCTHGCPQINIHIFGALFTLRIQYK